MADVHHSVRGQQRRRRRDRGFSLIVVFMLMLVMAGAAIAVLVGTRSDLTVSGVTREQKMALYAAEYAVARAKGLIASQTIQMFSPTTGWTPLLSATAPAAIQAVLCDPNNLPTGVVVGTQPGIVPLAANTFQTLVQITDSTGAAIPGQVVQWRYCVHNNADDPAYLNPALGPPSGNTTDQWDAQQHYIVIEAYGTAPNGASSHLTVNVGAPTLNAAGGPSSYAQEGAGSTHTGVASASESGIGVSGGVTTF